MAANEADLTALLDDARRGHDAVANLLAARVQKALHRIAGNALNREDAGHPLQDERSAVATSMGILGRSLDQLDSLAAGEGRVYPVGHFLMFSSKGPGEHHALARQFNEAEPMLLDSEVSLVASRGESAPIVKDARKRTVRKYEASRKPDEAARWRAQIGWGDKR